jgi:glycosyltransferase involved in cell wall biosynthesis
MKIAFVAGWPPEDKQGEANYASNIIKEYKRNYSGDEIIVYAHVSKGKTASTDFTEDNISNILVKRVTNGSSFFSRTFRSLMVPFRIIKDRCDVVHYQGVHTPLYGMLFGESMIFTFLILRICGVKQFYSLHSTWMKDDLECLVLEKKKNKISSYLFIKYYGFYLKAVYFFMNKVFVVSCGNIDIAVKAFLEEWKLDFSKTYKENHPCHLNDESPKASIVEVSNVNSVEKNILCLGYIRKDKGIHNLIRSFEQIALNDKNVKLIVGGEAIGKEGKLYVEHISELINKSPFNDRIEFIDGYIEQSNFQKLFTSASVVVIPYSRVIGPSGPIHYALGRNKIVVATNLGHNSNLADVVCLYDSTETLSDSLLKVLNDKAYVSNLKSGINKYVNDNSWSNMAIEYNNFYND